MNRSPEAQAQYERLLPEAIAAARAAWCPHSNFPVGAALLTADDRIIRGCNVENASYGLTNCAERGALFSAIAQGHAPASFKAMLVYAPNVALISPCGACRQVMHDLMSPHCVVYCVGHEAAAAREWTVEQLLPGAFGF
ncbi:cytidine deaminase [Pseudomonas sp. FSL R10-0056]|uniref:cytidine deaminase n=1 Tax=Pseudomonas TaxID=286 RepID=UPI001295CDAD|nr:MULTISPECIES: cytidine deaminase [unclassified Pseudomonas]MCH4881806.1 cytidine deaminase [Pseudomonas sp. TMW22080]MQT65474.1 cytidine deaminase [Pseudomonas sp. FSL R10-0056]MQT66827.1 cytidine deaminase [Pseudomonas sp. FSL R10-0071]MQT83562.1 cytidine deaminase [Pseudomonas sp. FSL R10-2964]MQU50703.1 cytidine deaminase [Pseudomonas sp. FSL A6-1183]